MASPNLHPSLYWYVSTNFGDMLAPYLLSKFFETDIKNIKYAAHDSDEHKFLITGSILSVENIRNATVFGAGFIFSNNYFTGKNIAISGVRGEMSLNKIRDQAGQHGNENIQISSDIIVGEPSLCLPIFYCKRAELKYKLGIIPHLFDYQRARSLYSHEPNVCIIDLAQHPGESLTKCIESIIFQIRQCEYIISSSLHGLIVAMAYGIPADWCEFSHGNLIGDRFKFYDFLSSVTNIISGAEYIKPIDLVTSKKSVFHVIASHRQFENEKISSGDILRAAYQLKNNYMQ